MTLVVKINLREYSEICSKKCPRAAISYLSEKMRRPLLIETKTKSVPIWCEEVGRRYGSVERRWPFDRKYVGAIDVAHFNGKTCLSPEEEREPCLVRLPQLQAVGGDGRVFLVQAQSEKGQKDALKKVLEFLPKPENFLNGAEPNTVMRLMVQGVTPSAVDVSTSINITRRIITFDNN